MIFEQIKAEAIHHNSALHRLKHHALLLDFWQKEFRKREVSREFLSLDRAAWLRAAH